MSLPNRKLSLALLLSLLLATTSISTAFNGPKGVGVGGSQAHRMTKKCKTKKLKKKKEKGESEGGPLPKDPKKASKEGEPEAAPKKESKTPEPKEPASKGPKGSPPAPKDDTPSAPKSDDAPKKRRRRRVETKKTPGPKEGTPPKDDKSKKSPKSAPKEDTEIAEDEWECTEWHLQEMKSSCSAVVEEMEDDDTDDSTAVALEQKVIVVPFSYTLTTRTGTVTDAEIEYMEEAIHDTIVKRQLKCEVQQRMVRRKLQQPEPDAPADVVVVGADPAPRDEPSTEQGMLHCKEK